MKQKFSSDIHEQFKKEFNIKDNPSQIDLDFLEKTRKYVNLIKWIPGIKMIGVGNSISMNGRTSDSDIDLFIVTSPNRLWFVRILITLFFQILGVRKTASKHAGRFCLSFFASNKALDFSSFKIENDIYLYFRILYFKPILDFDNTYKNFIEANSSWADFSEYKEMIEDNKKEIKISSPYPRYNSDFSFGGGEDGGRASQSKFLDFIEKLLKKIFLSKTLKTYEKLKNPFGVIISDNMLKFHDKDIRKKVRDKIMKS